MAARFALAGAVLTAFAAGAAAQVPLRVVTYNTKEGIADTAAAREAAGNLLTILDLDGAGPNTSLMPDLLCLQETTNTADLNSFRTDFLPGYQVRRGTITDGFNSNAFLLPGDWVVRKFDELTDGGPRRVLRAVFEVPGSSEFLVVYNAHFKAGSTGSDISTRATEANNMANRVSSDRANGIDVDFDGQVDFFPRYYLFVGDLNHDDFADTTIDPLIAGGSNGLPTELNDCRVETLAGAGVSYFVGDTFSTQGTLDNRYDYILASDEFFAQLDTSGNGTVSQAELNAAGFAYFSGDDLGLRASGDIDATAVGSDHAPVVLNFALPAEVTPCPGDLDSDLDVDLDDLSQLLVHFGTASGATYEDGDLDGDGDIDLDDLSQLLVVFGTTCA